MRITLLQAAILTLLMTIFSWIPTSLAECPVSFLKDSPSETHIISGGFQYKIENKWIKIQAPNAVGESWTWSAYKSGVAVIRAYVDGESEENLVSEFSVIRQNGQTNFYLLKKENAFSGNDTWTVAVQIGDDFYCESGLTKNGLQFRDQDFGNIQVEPANLLINSPDAFFNKLGL